MRTIRKPISIMLVLFMVLVLVPNGASAAQMRTITISECDHGRVTSDKTEAEEGVDTVTLTVYPDEGYALFDLAVMDKDRPYDDDYATPTTPNGNGGFYFTMPERDVLVRATFARIRTIKVGSELRLAHGIIIVDVGVKGGSNWIEYRDLPASGAECTMFEGQDTYVVFEPDHGYMLYRGFAAYVPVSGDRVYLDDDWVYVADGAEGGFTAPEGVGDYDIEINASYHFRPLAVNINDSIQNGSVTVDEIVRNGESSLYKQNASVSSSGPLYDFPVDKAAVGDTVILNVTPEEGYVLSELTVKDDFEADVAVENNSFTMPNSDVTVSAVFARENSAPAFMKQSLVLSGRIGVNFFMDLECLNEDQRAGSRVVFTIEDKDRATQTAYFDGDFKNEDGTLYGFTCYVNSVQMADNIHAEFFLEDGSQPAAVRDYSVQEYLESFDEDDGEEINALVKAINDYGYYAQLFLSERAGVPWVLGMDHAEMNTVYTQEYTLSSRDRASLRHCIISKDLADDVEAVTQSLTLDSGTSVNLYFKLAEGYEGTVEAAGQDFDVTVFRTSDGRYRVTMDNIPAHCLADMQLVTFTTDAGPSIVTVCPLSYVYACINDANEDDTCRNAMLALNDYYVKAMAYKNYVDAQNG